jgi:hypothetical protein
MSDDPAPEPPPVEWFAWGTIAPTKLDGYLLSTTHPIGRHKARLWHGVFGLSRGDGELLEQLIREHLHQATPVERTRTKVRRWELVIPHFRAPNGNEGPVLTAWALQPGKNRPHLTTAYPIVDS